MDRRSLIAIVLTVLVLLGWQMLIVKPKQEEAARRRRLAEIERLAADSLDAAGRPATGEETPGDTGGRSVAVEEAPVAAGEKEPAGERRPAGEGPVFAEAEPLSFAITSETMRVELTSRGGEIASVELLAFERKGNGLVQLVPEGARGGLALSLLTASGREILSGRVFGAEINGAPAVDGREYEIGADGARVVFTCLLYTSPSPRD